MRGDIKELKYSVNHKEKFSEITEIKTFINNHSELTFLVFKDDIQEQLDRRIRLSKVPTKKIIVEVNDNAPPEKK